MIYFFQNTSKSLFRKSWRQKNEPAGLYGFRKQVTEAKEVSLELRKERANVYALREEEEEKAGIIEGGRENFLQF